MDHKKVRAVTFRGKYEVRLGAIWTQDYRGVEQGTLVGGPTLFFKLHFPTPPKMYNSLNFFFYEEK